MSVAVLKQRKKNLKQPEIKLYNASASVWVSFYKIFSLKGKNLTLADQAVGEILFDATANKGVAELSYPLIEQKLRVKKSHTTIWRNIKKLSSLFEVTLISCRISSLGTTERNILQIKRTPEFNKIISALI